MKKVYSITPTESRLPTLRLCHDVPSRPQEAHQEPPQPFMEGRELLAEQEGNSIGYFGPNISTKANQKCNLKRICA